VKIKRRTRHVFENPSSSSDIAFLLIIYFIVIAGFEVNKGFLLTLPAKDSSRLIESKDLMRFELDNSGALHYEAAQTSITGAKEMIRSVLQANSDLAVLLVVDPQAPWQSVVSFVQVAHSLSIKSFSFRQKES
jgi:biopolymer transport protein ExbD